MMPTLPERIEIDTPKIGCDGGGALGHPLVYLKIDEASRKVECPYCGRLFVLKEGASAAAGH
jgi:uncharacterized Zn-finger protein